MGHKNYPAAEVVDLQLACYWLVSDTDRPCQEGEEEAVHRHL